MTNKKTKREYFEELKAIVIGDAEMVAFIDHELELLERKKASGSKSKASEENIRCAEWIENYLMENPQLVVTGSDLMKVIPLELIAKGEISQSKMTAIMSVLCGTWENPNYDATIYRFKDKRKTFYKLRNGETITTIQAKG